ncbi:hypothetical protein T02_7107 [Trichinella nativa]|uniref:Uncharacterized protein n=1 Tax=Trichinella nativa TaxID=6335 RepID=A0A0V1KQ95_9BILA|nr:hypothetical protein T02_7107 [Trichinella nativa]
MKREEETEARKLASQMSEPLFNFANDALKELLGFTFHCLQKIILLLNFIIVFSLAFCFFIFMLINRRYSQKLFCYSI